MIKAFAYTPYGLLQLLQLDTPITVSDYTDLKDEILFQFCQYTASHVIRVAVIAGNSIPYVCVSSSRQGHVSVGSAALAIFFKLSRRPSSSYVHISCN